jgi:DNA-3-methyladenine glycosylase I
MAVVIEPVTPDDRPWLAAFLTEQWGSPQLVSRGRLHDGASLPGFLARRGERWVGLITYCLEGDQCEIVSLNSLVEGCGIGTALIAAVREAARDAGCIRLWLVTTNDNLRAQAFYHKRGFILESVHRGAIAESRRLKPEIPLVASNGIPIEDELEFTLSL